MSDIPKYHCKVSGSQSDNVKFLFPELEGSTCCFLNKAILIPIGDNKCTQLCTSTNVWLDGDFLSAFTSLVSHYSHISDKSTTTSVLDFPQITHITYLNMQPTQNDFKQVPSNVKWLVAIMHNNQHYAVLKKIIAEQTIKVFDVLSHNLLGWKGYIITAMKKCMLVDCSVMA